MSTELPRTFKVITVWLLLGLLVFLGIQWWLHQQQQTRFSANGGVIEIRRGVGQAMLVVHLVGSW